MKSHFYLGRSGSIFNAFSSRRRRKKKKRKERERERIINKKNKLYGIKKEKDSK